jgi:CheY-like chemotaxis protein
MQIGGALTVTTANVTLGPPLFAEEPPAGDDLEVGVTDTGTGMSDEVRTKVFEPFFTTKEIGKGSGLGLSQVLGFAKQSGGGVRIESWPGRGTSVRIYLPRAAAKATTDRARQQADLPAESLPASILVVDDDDAVRDITAAMLRERGYTVFEAGSGGAALDMIERVSKIDLMLIDFAMPGMSGAEVARHFQAKRPAIPILFVTGFADRAALAGVSEAHIIGKPFIGSELAEKVALALRGEVGANVVRLRVSHQ